MDLIEFYESSDFFSEKASIKRLQRLLNVEVHGQFCDVLILGGMRSLSHFDFFSHKKFEAGDTQSHGKYFWSKSRTITQAVVDIYIPEYQICVYNSAHLLASNN